MKFVKFAAASLMLPGFSPVFADSAKVFSDGCNSPAEITGQTVGACRPDYGDSGGYFDITGCAASGRLDCNKPVPASVGNCTDTKISPDTGAESAVWICTQPHRLEHAPDSDSAILENGTCGS